jgi:thiol:disulfide interchange protein
MNAPTRVLLAASAILALCAFAQKPTTAKVEPGWTNDLAKAMARAKKEHKLVMVDFNATWCGPCQMYKHQVFPGAKFKAATKNVILVDIDTDQQPGIAQKYQVQGIPDIRFFSPQWKQVGGIVGFGGEDRLLAELKKAQAAVK